VEGQEDNKSGIILFTLDQKQFHTHPQVIFDWVLSPLNQKIKWLGVNLDPKVNFGDQNTAQCIMSNSRIPVMKALAGTDWGHDMETLLLTYKMLVRPTFTFGSPIWYPNTSATNLKKSQVIQNKGPRISAEHHLKTPIAQLHAETKVLPVKNHFEMLNFQFLASAMRCSHCSHDIVTLPPLHQKMKKTLYDANIEFVRPYLQDGVILEVSYKRTIQSIHSAFVAQSSVRMEPNIKDDRTLPQKTTALFASLGLENALVSKPISTPLGKLTMLFFPSANQLNTVPVTFLNAPSTPQT
jgi:hypothetical protein